MRSDVLDRLGLQNGGYTALTLHRPSNVDDMAVFGRIVDALEVIAKRMPVVFPIHPRTRKNIESADVGRRIGGMANLKVIEPLPYLDFSKLMLSAKVVLTDSGGIQEETTFLGIPCVTLRENTERPPTVEVGTNRVVGTDTGRILSAFEESVGGSRRDAKVPPLWDGRAAERIVEVMLDHV